MKAKKRKGLPSDGGHPPSEDKTRVPNTNENGQPSGLSSKKKAKAPAEREEGQPSEEGDISHQEKEVKGQLLSKKAQQTMIQFLESTSSADSDFADIVDRYSPLRLAKVHVYATKEIESAAPLRAQYLKFWNEECLALLNSGNKKCVLEAMVKKSWNYSGRFDSYINMGKDIAELHKLDVDWDSKYRKNYKTKIELIDVLEKSKEVELSSFEERIRKGTSPRTTKSPSVFTLPKLMMILKNKEPSWIKWAKTGVWP